MVCRGTDGHALEREFDGKSQWRKEGAARGNHPNFSRSTFGWPEYIAPTNRAATRYAYLSRRSSDVLLHALRMACPSGTRPPCSGAMLPKHAQPHRRAERTDATSRSRISCPEHRSDDRMDLRACGLSRKPTNHCSPEKSCEAHDTREPARIFRRHSILSEQETTQPDDDRRNRK